MQISKIYAVIGLIIIIGFFMHGCASMPKSQSNDAGEAVMDYSLKTSSQTRFEDLPVPSGFRLIREQSFVFQNNQTRMGTLSYMGKAEFNSLVDFYKKYMALAGWNIVNSVEFGKVVLNFEKEQESCIVTLEKRSSSKAIITLSLSPASRPNINKNRTKKETESTEEKIIVK